MDFDWQHLPLLWGNPMLMAAFSVALTEALRKKWPTIDGPIRVPAFAGALGAATGALGGALGLVTVEPFNAWPGLPGGAAYGLLAALSGVLGVNLLDVIVKLFTKNKVEPLTFVSSGAEYEQASEFIFTETRLAVGEAQFPKALEIVAPLLLEFGHSLLTDQVRAELQARIHKLLKGAKLIPERDFP